MRRSITVLLCAFATWALLVAVPVHARSPKAKPWKGEATAISGTARYDRGEWIYTDFVYDDYGADTVPAGQPSDVGLAPASGDFRYPDGAEFAGNAADIVEVRARLAAGGDDLEVRVLLQTLIDPETVALWVEVDGTDDVITTRSPDGNVLGIERVSVDPETNTVSFVVSDVARGDRVTLSVGAGLHDGDGGLRAGVPGTATLTPGEFTTGGPTDARLFDLAFNTRDIEGRGGAWNEDAQSDALAAGDIGAFTQEIDLGALRQRARTNLAVEPGYYVRLFSSQQDLGEGIADSFPQFRGEWQPYALWIPEGYDPRDPSPLFLSLHSLEVHHNQFRGGSSPTYTRYYEQFGDRLGAVVVTPLGRGPDGWYHDEGLIDTLEVWADVLAHHAIDPERILVGGYSMGGYGTYRLTTLMPDSFASAVSVVGPPVDGIWAYPLPPTGGEDAPGNTRPQLENTRHVPIWITHGAADELVPVAGVAHQAERLAELGHEYRFALHPVADHLSFAVQDDWIREAAWFESHLERVTDPHRVTLKVRPATWASDDDPTILHHLTELVNTVGGRVDGGYWVGDVVVAGDGDTTAFVDLASDGIAERRSGVETVTGVGTDGPSPYVLSGADVVVENAPEHDVLRGQLSDVASLTVDVGRAGLSDAPAIEVETDGPVKITFVRNGTVVGAADVG